MPQSEETQLFQNTIKLVQKVSLGRKHAVADEAFKFTAKPATSFKRTELIIAGIQAKQFIEGLKQGVLVIVSDFCAEPGDQLPDFFFLRVCVDLIQPIFLQTLQGFFKWFANIFRPFAIAYLAYHIAKALLVDPLVVRSNAFGYQGIEFFFQRVA